MVDNFINNTEQSNIINTTYKTRNFVPMQQFRHKQMRSFDDSSSRLAIDSSGQHALIGAVSDDKDVFIQHIDIGSLTTRQDPNNTIGYDEISWDGLMQAVLYRLQFIPGGNNMYAATWNRGVRIIDTNTNQLLTEHHRDGVVHRSDWHPRDKYLIAMAGNISLNLLDIRVRPASVPCDFYPHYVFEDHVNFIKFIPKRSCLWNTKDDDYLVTVDRDGFIETFDRRTMKAVHTKKYDVEMFDMQMTPNGKYLFGWCTKNHRLSQWKYDLDGLTFVRNIPLDVWELQTGVEYRSRLQYHVTDTHLFMPNKSTNWLPNESNTTAIRVIDVETGDKVDDIKAVKRGYNPTSETYDYARVDAVVGVSNGHHEDQLYTLSDKCELGVWWLSGSTQEEPGMQLVDLERGREEGLSYNPMIHDIRWPVRQSIIWCTSL